MRLTMILLSVFFTTSSHAERTGTDERIHMCTAASDAKDLGPNKQFRVHVTAGKEIKLTRLSDKKWFRAIPNNSSYYIFDKKDGGNFWPTSSQGGYMSDIDKNGVLDIAIQDSPGSYHGNRLGCKLVRTISKLDPLTATEKLLIAIAERANVANGGYDVSKYDLKTFDLEVEKTNLNKHRRKGCSWTMTDDPKAAIAAIKAQADDGDVSKDVQGLQSKPGLKAAIAIVSDNDVSCSLAYVWLFTTDGHKLELMYDQGD